MRPRGLSEAGSGAHTTLRLYDAAAITRIPAPFLQRVGAKTGMRLGVWRPRFTCRAPK